MYLCNEGGCGLRRSSTPYIKMCIIIRQLLFLRHNGPKKRFNWLWKVKHFKSISEGCSTLEGYWGVITEPSKVLLQIVKGLQETGWDKRMQINCQRSDKNQTWSHQEAIILQCGHIPELWPTSGPRSLRCSETWLREAETTTEQDTLKCQDLKINV